MTRIHDIFNTHATAYAKMLTDIIGHNSFFDMDKIFVKIKMWITNLEYNILSNNFFLVMFDALICFWIFFVPFARYTLKIFLAYVIIWPILCYMELWTILKTEVQYDKLKIYWLITEINYFLSCSIVDWTSNQGQFTQNVAWKFSVGDLAGNITPVVWLSNRTGVESHAKLSQNENIFLTSRVMTQTLRITDNSGKNLRTV